MNALSCSRVLRFHSGPVHIVKYDVNGEYSLSGGSDKRIILSKPHSSMTDDMSSRPLQSYEGHRRDILCIVIGVNHRQFASSGIDKQIYIWDVLRAGSIRKLAGHESRVNSLDLSENGNVLVSGGNDGIIKCWDLRNAGMNKYPIQMLNEAKDAISLLKMNNDTKELVSASVDGKVRIYDLRKGLVKSLSLGVPVTSFDYAPHSYYILMSTLDSTIRLFDLKDGILLNEYWGHVNEKLKVNAVILKNEKWIVSGSEDGNISGWDLVKGQASTQQWTGHSLPVTHIEPHPHNSWFLSASADGTIRVWESEKTKD